MATVTGLTAQRMQQIIDQQILQGAVDLSGRLVMTRADGSSFDAGSVVGPPGPSGDPLSLSVSEDLELTGSGTPTSPYNASLPARLSVTGGQVTDWNDAVSPGFYWCDFGALNSPADDRYVGEVFLMGGGSLAGRIVQELRLPTNGITGSRVYSRVFDGVWRPWREIVSEPLPAPLESVGNGSAAITSGADAWTTIPGAVARNFGVLSRPLRVQINYTAIAVSTSTSVYVMLGVRTTGGLAREPEVNQAGATNRFEYTPFASTPQHSSIGGTKILTIPSGPATSFHLCGRRNGTTGSQGLNYSKMEVIPLRWE